MTTLPRLGAPLRLAWTRLAARPERAALVVCGVAIAAALLAVVYAGSLVVQDRTVGRSVERLPDSSRAVRAGWFGVAAQAEGGYAGLDRAAFAALEPIVGTPPTRTALFRESTIAGRFIGLGGVDGLGRWVRLRSGRMPRPCRPDHCEVLQLRGTDRIPNAPGLRLIRVGRADLVSGVLFGDAIPPVRSGRAAAELSPSLQAAGRYHEPPPAPLLLAEGVDGLARSPVLAPVFRSYGWVVPLARGSVHPWSLERTAAATERARSELEARASFDVTAPLEELTAAADQARVAGRRLLLLGGQAAALLLAFALLAAARLRRDSQGARLRLTWLGARRSQLLALTTGEVGAMVVAGTLVGWLVGAATAAVVAREAGSPAGGVLSSSVLGGDGLLLAAALAVVATAAGVAALTLRPFRLGGLSLSPLDGAALAALAIVAVALARGAADEAALRREGGTGFVLLLLPALLAFAAAVGTARLVGPAFRALARMVPERAVAVRLAALSLARNPGHAAVAVGFLVVSVGLALFAEAYRATLVRGQHDQAAFTVPADVVLREDLSRLVPVSSVVTPTVARELAREAKVEPVIRLESSVSGRVGATGITVLGLDARRLARLDGWRSDFSAEPPSALARGIEPTVPVELRGPVIPAGATRLVLPAAAHGSGLSLLAYVRSRAGRVFELDLGRVHEGRRVELAAAVPPAARGGRVLGFRLLPPPRIVERGANAGHAAEGTLALGPLAAIGSGGRVVLERDYARWLGVNGVSPGRRAIRFGITNQAASYLRPRQPVDGLPVPVVASPAVAALADRQGLLPLRVSNAELVTRVAAVADRFPGTRGDFVVADERLLAAALDTASPGSAMVGELWLDADSPALAPELEAALRRPPFDVLQKVSRRAYANEIEAEPIARGSLLMLVAAAVVAVALAVAGLALGVLTELRDERGELLDLEAQGAAPSALRRQLRLRALAVGVFGLVGGVLAGALLAALVVRLVALTASATEPEPPLVLSLGWSAVLAGLVLGGIAAAALVLTATARAFRSPAAARAGVSAP